MRVALLADIHSNLEALRACLAHARRQGAEQHIFLGDLVGYGADPVACLEIIAGLVARGARAVLGNHDEAAIGGLCENLNFPARDAIYWTRTRLGAAERKFLKSLPLVLHDEDLACAHATMDKPAAWRYVTSSREATRSFAATDARVILLGHVHHAILHYTAEDGRPRTFRPFPGVAIPLSALRRWIAIPGAVGQPRDGNNAACYGLLDRDQDTYTSFRVPYDCHGAARKILAAGLPERLARRLESGH